MGTNTIASVTGSNGNFVVGRAQQRHIVYAKNSAVWWCFWVDPASTTTLRSAYSSDLVTWTTSTTLTLAHALDGGNEVNGTGTADGRNLGVYCVANSTTDVVHVAVVTFTSSSSYTVYDCRATVTSSSISWGTANSAGTATSNWSPDGTSPVIAADGSNLINTGAIRYTGHGLANEVPIYNATKDTGASYTPGSWSQYNAELAGDAFTSRASFPISSGTVLLLWDNGPSVDGQNTNIRWAKADISGTTPSGADVFATTSTIDSNDWGACRVSSSDFHCVRRTGTNTYEHRRFNGTSWSAGQSITNQNSQAGGGLAMTSDGTNVYLAVIDTDTAHTVRYCVWNGTSWGSWIALDSSTNTTRGSLTAQQESSNGSSLAICWTENPSGTTYNIRVAGIPLTTAVSLSDSATGTDSYTSTGITLPTDAATGTNSAPTFATIAPTVTDSATGSDSVKVGIILPTDAATGTNSAPSISATFTATDSATATDSVKIGVVLPTDAASGSNTFSLATVAVTLTDSATGTNSYVSTGLTLALNTGTGSDSVSISATVPLADSGSGANTASISATFSLSNSGTGSDSCSASASFNASNSGTGSDSISAELTTFSLADSATGNDSISVFTGGGGPTTFTVTDSAAGTDSVSVHATFSASDSGTATDTASISATFSLSQSGTGANTLAVSASFSLSQSGSGADSFSLGTIAFGVSDAGSGSDSQSGHTTFSSSDSATATDSLGLLVIPLLTDSATGTHQVVILAKPSLSDAGSGLDVIGGWSTVSFGLANTGSGSDQAHVVSVVLSSPTGVVILLASPTGAVILKASASASVAFVASPTGSTLFKSTPSGSTTLDAAPTATGVVLK